MNNQEHQTLRLRLYRLDPWMVFRAITGRTCPRTGDEGMTPYDEEEPGGPQWRLDAKHRTIKCEEMGKGGHMVQFVMDVTGKYEVEAEKYLCSSIEDMLLDDLAKAREKDPNADDIYTNKIIDLSKYDSEPDEKLSPYYDRGTTSYRYIMAAVLHEMQRNFWRSEEAKAFAESRGWSEQMCRNWDLGYCDWHTIESAADNNGWPRTMLVELGFLREGDKGQYDALHGRIVMPVYDRFGSVTGYNSRIMPKEEARQKAAGLDPIKYKSANDDTWLEPKSTQLYGLHRASGAIQDNRGKCYVVEGNPDAMRMHSIGVENCVAQMGTGINDSTIESLKLSRISHVCFIPDLDVPAEGEAYGPGIKTVMKNGKELIKAGITVSVKELPWPKTRKQKVMEDDGTEHLQNVPNPLKKKVDADDWFNPLKKAEKYTPWEDIVEQSFVVWYALKTKDILPENPTPEQRNEWTLDIAEMLSYMDESLRNDYVSDLVQKWKAVNKTKWNEAIKHHIGERKQREARKNQRSTGNLRDYGIQESGGCYYMEGSEEPFTNFVIEPHYYIEKWGDSHWICRAISTTEKERVIDIDNDTITSAQKFKSSMASLAMRCKISKSGAELDSLFAYISENAQDVRKVDKLGWQPSIGVWAWGNGVTVPNDDAFHGCNEYGVSDYGQKVHLYIPSAAKISGMNEEDSSDGYEWERSLSYEETQSWSLAKVFDLIVKVYGDNGKVALMFLVASIFRDVVNTYSQGFPILCGYGPRGSGKSSIGSTITSFFSTSSGMKITLGESTTDSSLDLLLGHGQNIVVQLDEYKNTIRESQIAIIKAIWDSEGRSVRNMNSKNKSSSKTKVRCGVVVTGQEIPNVEAAMFSRFLPCEFYDDKAAQLRCKKDFDLLKSWEARGFSYLTRQILNCRQEFDDDFQLYWDETCTQIDDMLNECGEQVMVRIKNNWCAILASMRTLSRHEWWPFTYDEACQLVLNRIREQNKMNDQSDERADFWRNLFACVSQFRIRKGAHYRIKPSRMLNRPSESLKFKPETRAQMLHTIEWAQAKCSRVLLLRYDDVYPIIRAFAKAQGDDSKLMDSGSMRSYINKAGEGYLGDTSSECFGEVDKDGRPMLRYDSRRQKPTIVQNRKSGVMMFDYDFISEKYDIDLESIQSIMDDTEGHDDNTD